VQNGPAAAWILLGVKWPRLLRGFTEVGCCTTSGDRWSGLSVKPATACCQSLFAVRHGSLILKWRTRGRTGSSTRAGAEQAGHRTPVTHTETHTQGAPEWPPCQVCRPPWAAASKPYLPLASGAYNGQSMVRLFIWPQGPVMAFLWFGCFYGLRGLCNGCFYGPQRHATPGQVALMQDKEVVGDTTPRAKIHQHPNQAVSRHAPLAAAPPAVPHPPSPNSAPPTPASRPPWLLHAQPARVRTHACPSAFQSMPPCMRLQKHSGTRSTWDLLRTIQTCQRCKFR